MCDAGLVLQWVTIGSLPDNVLLEIFHSHLVTTNEWEEGLRGWQRLVHVCRRWRCDVLGTPARLKLELCYTPVTPSYALKETAGYLTRISSRRR
jgi:F-box-like